MKSILGLALVVLFSQGSFAASEFWCEPVSHKTKLENVIARSSGDSHQLFIYTTSSRWGAVDETVMNSSRTDANDQILYVGQDAELTVLPKVPVGEIEGFVKGIFKVPSQTFEMEMICEVNP